jgi:hypothetical protein
MNHGERVTMGVERMTGSHEGALKGALIERRAILSGEQDVRLSLPEATMFIVGTSGFLWAMLFGAFNYLFG